MTGCKYAKGKSELLLDLMEAILAERYEDCAGLICEAKNLGAEERQVQEILNYFSEGCWYIPADKLGDWA